MYTPISGAVRYSGDQRRTSTHALILGLMP